MYCITALDGDFFTSDQDYVTLPPRILGVTENQKSKRPNDGMGGWNDKKTAASTCAPRSLTKKHDYGPR